LEVRDRNELFSAWRLFFERLADVYPTVLVFEDMQWADASLLDFVEYLVDSARAHPLYVVTLGRPELVERRPTWGAGLRNFTSLYLEPLSPAAMQQLLVGLVPGLPAGLRDQILDRAEGIPLYAVETVRMLLDRGALVLEGSAYRPVGEIASLEVPETLHALIAARLDGLPAEERRLLQDGAVLGKTFAKPAIAALTGRSEEELEPLLLSLVRKEVLGVQADPRSPEHGQYGFLQDLVRHVAYETLSRRERKARHLAAASHVGVALSEDEVAAVVASHLLDAYRAVPDADDAHEIRDRAREALTRAGERAGSLGASSEAQRYFEQAAELVDDPAALAPLAERAGHMAWLAGRPVESRALLDRAEAAFERLGDIGSMARVAGRLAEIDFVEGHPREAVERLEPALASISDGEHDAEVAAIAGQLGRFLVLSGDPDRALTHLERALGLAERLGLPDTLAHAMISKGILLIAWNRLHEARVLLEGAIELAGQHDLYTAVLRGVNNLGVVLEASDEFTESDARVGEAIRIARQVGDRGWEASLLGGQMLALVMLGRWDEALSIADQAEEIATTSYAQALLLDLVTVYCERGQLEHGRRLLDRLLAGLQSSEDVQTIVGRAVVEAHLLRLQGRPAEAREQAERGLAVARESFAPVSVLFKVALEESLEVALAQGDLAWANELLAILDPLRPGEQTPLLAAIRARFQARLAAPDDPAAADRHFAQAARIYREIDLPFRLAVVLLERAECLLGEGRARDAEPMIREATATFEQLQAQPWIERAAQAAHSGQESPAVV
ncbi:MAG: ATP-binding protein, partial [Gaiellales bacterium]